MYVLTSMNFTDCESCTRPISTKPGSMEAGEYEITRGTCFVARRLELVTVAGLLWVSCGVCWVRRDFVSFFCRFLFFERTRPAASMRPPCLIYLSTSNGSAPVHIDHIDARRGLSKIQPTTTKRQPASNASYAHTHTPKDKIIINNSHPHSKHSPNNPTRTTTVDPPH